MADNAVMYTAVYDDMSSALADLDTFEQLHEEEMIGDYDAAVVDKEDGKPHVVKRVDHPRINVIRELAGHGSLAHNELHEAADQLDDSQAALIVVGEPTIGKGFDQAVTHATKTAKHELETATDQLSKDLSETSVR